MSNVMATGVLVGLFFMLFWTPYLMASGIESLNGKLSIGQKAICMIPIVNIIRAEKHYKAKLGLCSYSIILFFVAFALRMITLFFMHEQVVICTISVLFLIGTVALYYIANCLFVAMVINDADAMDNMIKKVCAIVIYPFGQFFIGHYLSIVIANAAREQKAFEANGIG